MSLFLARMRPNGPSVTHKLLMSPTSSCSTSFLSQLVSSIPEATVSRQVRAARLHAAPGAGGNGHGLTVICQDDDVETAMKADLLEAVHQLTDDPVYVLQGQNQLQETGTQSTLVFRIAARRRR